MATAPKPLLRGGCLARVRIDGKANGGDAPLCITAAGLLAVGPGVVRAPSSVFGNAQSGSATPMASIGEGKNTAVCSSGRVERCDLCCPAEGGGRPVVGCYYP